VSDTSILIVGGGIAGLAASLAGWGRDVAILEKTRAFEPVGAGLQIGPNAVSALRSLGAWEPVEAITQAPAEIHMRDGRSGKLLKRIRLGAAFERRFGAPYRTALRADLHAALLSVVKTRPEISIALGQHIEGIENNSLLLHNRSLTAQGVIIADGVHSKLRQKLISGSPPIDSGLVFHRALLPFSSATNDGVTVWMLPGAHVVEYAVGRPAKLNVVVIRPIGETHVFDGAAAPLQNIIQHVPTDTPWPGLFLNPLSQWNFGNTVLIGDAAHGTLPFLAQGAAMALEDAAALRKALAKTNDLPAAFADYSGRRVARATRLHHASIRAGKNYHLDSMQAWARNMVLRALPDQALWTSLNWLYSHKS
jgi:salicylate hydroxylase